MSILRLKRGDSAKWEFPVLKADGVTPQPIDGMSIRFTAKNSQLDADAAAVLARSTAGGGVIITNGPGGLCEVRLTPADTGALAAPGRLWWDIQIADGSGDVWTVDEGLLLVAVDITRTAP